MGSRWKKLRSALGLGKLCAYVPSTLEDDAPPPSIERDGRRTGFSSASATSSGSLPTSVFLSSKQQTYACAICLGSMRSGKGRALFTAECSHTFHFDCIVSNVMHGNNVCPVCRGTWTEIPFQAPRNEQPQGRPSSNTTTTTNRVSPDDGNMTVLRRSNTTGTGRRQSTMAALFDVSEPALYNDDEPVVPPPRCREGRSSGEEVVEVNAYTEFPAVERWVSKEKFRVLIHLKAPLGCPIPPPPGPPPTSTGTRRTGTSRSNVQSATRASRAPPVDLVTVLDVSGSMAGTKLALLKRAMGFVIQNLGSSDRLSVVSFSSTARRVLHLRRMTESGRRHAVEAVNGLVSSGGTNIAEGLRKAGKVMDERLEKNPVSTMILLSDGQDTYTMSGANNTNYEPLLPASARSGSGAPHVPVHTFGFGADHNPAALHSISETSGGTFSFIETERVIQDAFAQCIGGILSVVVQEVRATVECVHPGVRVSSAKSGSYGVDLASDGTKVSVNLGDLYSEEERDLLVSLNVPRVEGEATTSTPTTVLLKVGCVYREPVSGETIHVNAKDVGIPRPVLLSTAEAVPSIEVDRERNRLRATEAMAEARAHAEKGELMEAVGVLQKCRLALRDTPSARAEDALCAALDVELRETEERMASRHRYEASGRAYVLSGLSSHSWQRATTRGTSTDCGGGRDSSQHLSYQTPSMVNMLTRSQTLLLTSVSEVNDPVRPTLSPPPPPLRSDPSLLHATH